MKVREGEVIDFNVSPLVFRIKIILFDVTFLQFDDKTTKLN